jgi:uncharacterized protein YjiS (DUF1127 family)
MLMKPYQFEFEVGSSPDVWSTKHHDRPGFFTRLVQRIEAYAEHKRQRHALRALDDRLLKDIGISRSEAERISAEPFRWDRELRSRGV